MRTKLLLVESGLRNLAVGEVLVCLPGLFHEMVSSYGTLRVFQGDFFMRTGIAMGLAICLLLGADAVRGEETLQGTWRLSAGEVNGKALSEQQLQDGKLVIDGDHYSVTLDGKGTSTGVQKLDPTLSTKTIDIMDTSGPHKDQICLGIYELKGDEFHVAFAPPGKARPSKMSTTSDSGYWTHIWKRAKE